MAETVINQKAEDGITAKMIVDGRRAFAEHFLCLTDDYTDEEAEDMLRAVFAAMNSARVNSRELLRIGVEEVNLIPGPVAGTFRIGLSGAYIFTAAITGLCEAFKNIPRDRWVEALSAITSTLDQPPPAS